ncbi:DUF1080 domain-containing protein [Planctomyces sp. SH-PL14]|uniref:3-keto-disaccharide hydrolase n=1 Tax=Planctomyces sp. SH-PL14 TaxID=1632864 RepID=UPI00078B8829|nr:DUF1080 domain-containing protein [Planctomyces sp. SH-PL14]AMV18094.1 hypothetical protein VT03_09405 [Planctomyces sp. SH-PL14]
MRTVLFASALGLAFAGCAPAPAPAPSDSASPAAKEAAPPAAEKTTPPEAPADPMTAAVAAKPAAAPAPLTPPSTAECIPYVNPLTAEEIEAGWLSLFDGHTLFGWASNQSEVNWSVKDGTITADSGPIGLLNTTVPFADFEFRCEFRTAEGANSGVFLRTTADPKDLKADCYELNIADEQPEGFLTGSIVGWKKTDEPIKGSGDWRKFSVTAEGNRVRVQLDGKEIMDFTDESAARKSGLLGLQKNKGKVEFRNLAVKPLGMEKLFNGKDTAGWTLVPGSKSKFDIVDGAIHCHDGPGFLETEREFGNFVARVDAQTHAADLNSGYFFRAMKGTEKDPSNGYEVQVHNGIENGDPCRASNAGTGAIFRRVSARRVIPKDKEWCTTTLVANGNRMAVWVNGYAVVDWEDTRKPDENPRKGQRTKAGHISLQGHDPTTDVSFRNIQVVELP